LDQLPDPEWLVDDLIGENALVELYGKPGTGKSFLAIDLAMSVAAGRPWLGRPTKQGDVVYIYAEGTTALKLRVQAWRDKRAADRDHIAFLPQSLDIADTNARDELIAAIRAAGLKPRLLVIDTVARCFGTGDENSTKDMNAFVASLDAIRKAFEDTTILVVHHAGKNAGRGERGSTALRGAADAVMYLEAHGRCLTLRCEKQKDAEEFGALSLERVLVRLPNGQTSCVVEAIEGTVVRGGQPLQTDEKALQALRQSGQEGASFTDWQAASGLTKSTFKDARKRLLKRGHVIETAGRYLLAEFGTGDGKGTEEGRPSRAAWEGRKAGPEHPLKGFRPSGPAQPQCTPMPAAARPSHKRTL
jgi:hypothetical protein